MLECQWKLPASSQYSFLGKTKRLDLRRNQAFHNASSGDKRDRTADLLNAIYAQKIAAETEKASAALLISVCVA